jgi:hypothetical protein
MEKFAARSPVEDYHRTALELVEPALEEQRLFVPWEAGWLWSVQVGAKPACGVERAF